MLLRPGPDRFQSAAATLGITEEFLARAHLFYRALYRKAFAHDSDRERQGHYANCERRYYCSRLSQVLTESEQSSKVLTPE